MNRLLYTVLVSWHTSNQRHQRKAENYCKDFGLAPLQKTLYVGTLYRNERTKLSKKLKELLIHKKELYHSFTICSSCLTESSIGKDIQSTLHHKPMYEMVQCGK